MKTKILMMGLLCFLLFSCSADVYQDSMFYDNYSVEQIWNASLEIIQEMKFVVKNIEKESGYIYSEFESGTLFTRTSEGNPQLVIYIGNANGKTRLICQCIRCDYIRELGWGTGKDVAKIFMKKLNEKLNH